MCDFNRALSLNRAVFTATGTGADPAATPR